MRLVTRGNLDGLCCAVIISGIEPIDSIELIHPQDITDNLFEIREGDILANLPYAEGCAKWFDHHAATHKYDKPPENFEGSYGVESSSARLVYDYYREPHPEIERFERFVRETERFDAADLTLADVTDPEGYILLGFTLDPRTGLGEFRQYFLKLVEWSKTNSLEELMDREEVKERVERIFRDRERFYEVMQTRSRVDGNVIVTDLREAGKIPVGNRFLIYTLYPDANAWVRLAWGPERKFAVATVGHSIFNRTCPVHVGELLATYGGGGHEGAGATPLPSNDADRLVAEIVGKLQG